MEIPMIYFGYQITPVPGKRDKLIEANGRFKKIVESHGGRAVGSFRVSLGQGDGNLIYFLAYDDMAKATAAGEALENDSDYQALVKETESLIASVTSALLQPLPDSALQ
jgi:maltose-binding protein MalE